MARAFDNHGRSVICRWCEQPIRCLAGPVNNVPALWVAADGGRHCDIDHSALRHEPYDFDEAVAS